MICQIVVLKDFPAPERSVLAWEKESGDTEATCLQVTHATGRLQKPSEY